MDEPERVRLPEGFEDVDVDILVQLVADMLVRLITHNDRVPLSPEAVTRFHSRSAPGISVLDYLRRIVQFTRAERVCLLITLHYIDQICTRIPTFTLSSLTCHRFVITSIAVSSKALCDAFSTNNLYARVGGIPVGELNMLEREFLRMIDWSLTCTREVLQEYYASLVRTHSAVPSSRPSSPSPAPGPTQASTILVETTTVSPEPPQPPTVEQNMAYHEFQQQGRGGRS
ncbi:cyclin-domain-containing protein [Irpex rosettiformis]|uniref:Cyclin-domain-containing protein n=1 Tax=Irpex rosettiformis TaxID=378272 RepID=A0ACB8UFW6_9APHY|nr:cyclin-domain-containing protein [Irpex rosettiformis]